MDGYTDGVAEMLSEQSLTMGLFTEGTTLKGDRDTYPEQIKDFLDNYLADDEIEQATSALMETRQYDRDDGYSIFISDNGVDDIQLEYQLDDLDTLESLAAGGLQALIKDADPNDDSEIIGWRLGAAGEHIGSVSVWLDTYNGVLRQGGQSYQVSDDDTNKLNDMLAEIYGETLGDSGEMGLAFGVVDISELNY